MHIGRETVASHRFGYGRHPALPGPDGPEALLDELRLGAIAPLALPLPPPQVMGAYVPPHRGTPMSQMSDAARSEVQDRRKAQRRAAIREGARRILGRALSPYGFFERVSAFWVDHFSVGVKIGNGPGNIVLMEPEAIRPNLMTSFYDLVLSVSRHPAMLAYLDQNQNFGPHSVVGRNRDLGLNENFARELLELHTLGVGASYSQDDVRNVARLLTGWAIDPRSGAFRFQSRRAEPGVFEIMGKSYGGPRSIVTHGETLIWDLAVHPVTARHISRKLAVHFVSDTPPDDLIEAMTAAWLASDGFLPDVYRTLVEHPAAWAEFGAKVRRPEEIVVATYRAGGLTPDEAEALDDRELRRLLATLRGLGQPFFRPPSPAGWPEAADDWITPQGLASRLEFASQEGRVLAKRDGLDPRDFARTLLGDALRPDTIFAVERAAEHWEGFAYALASPEFQRR